MAGYKILVIDGDLASRNFIAEILRNEGHTVLLAPSGKRGLIAAWRDSPDLIIADPLLGDLPGEELAARLRSDPRSARVPLVALSNNPRTARLLSWLDSGFDDYLIKSPKVIPLLKASIADLLGSGSEVDKQGGLLIAFLSAKGGLGTSSLCANIAMSVAENEPQLRAVVADLVLPMGSIAEIVGYEGPLDLVTMAQKPASETTPEWLRRSLPRPEAWRFRLLAGSPDPEKGNRLNLVRISSIVSALKLAYDFVLLDLGRSLSRISLPLIERADLIVITASAERDTAKLTRTAWDYLKTKGVQASSAYVILNRAIRVEGLTKEEVEEAIGLPVRAAVPHLGENLSLANTWHVPYALKFPNDTATMIIKQTAQELVTSAKRVRAG